MTSEPKYLTIQQAAAALGVDRKRIRRMIQEGQLEAVVNPVDRREKLVRREEIDALLDFAKKVAA